MPCRVTVCQFNTAIEEIGHAFHLTDYLICTTYRCIHGLIHPCMHTDNK